MATYRGGPEGQVFKNGKPLEPLASQAVWNHSPDGFNWGYGGSGPAQLALALLLDVTEDKQLAKRYHQAFKWEVVARWPQGGPWEMSTEEVKLWLLTKNVPVV